MDKSNSEERAIRPFTPETVHPGFGRYHQAVEVPAGYRLLFLSGLLGIDRHGVVADGCAAQIGVILDGIDACLADAGMARSDLVQLRTYLVEPEDRPVYMALRDQWVPSPEPASTLLFVKALASPEYRVEIEAVAAAR